MDNACLSAGFWIMHVFQLDCGLYMFYQSDRDYNMGNKSFARRPIHKYLILHFFFAKLHAQVLLKVQFPVKVNFNLNIKESINTRN